jgi:hypothetical protein
MNDIFLKLLEALKNDGIFYADFSESDRDACINIQKGDKFFEVKVKER